MYVNPKCFCFEFLEQNVSELLYEFTFEIYVVFIHDFYIQVHVSIST